jgi:hypothetical protein
MKASSARSTITQDLADITAMSWDDNSAAAAISSSPRTASTAQPP